MGRVARVASVNHNTTDSLTSRDVVRNALYRACETLALTYSSWRTFARHEEQILISIHAKAATVHLTPGATDADLAAQLAKVTRTLRKLGVAS